MKTHSALRSFLPAGPARRFWASLLFTGALLLPGAVSAATRTVTSLADSGAGSLRATIAAAGAGDIIQFGVSGTITLTSDTLIIDKNVTIVHDNPATLIIERSAAGGVPTFGIIKTYGSFEETTPGTVSVSGLTFRNGYGNYAGGAIYAYYVKLTVTNCVFTDNRAVTTGNFTAEGGAIHCASTALFNGDLQPSGLTLTDCTFTGNLAAGTISGGEGGAVSVISTRGVKCTLNATNCTFTNNSAERGGAVFCDTLNGSTGSAFIAGTFTGNHCPAASGSGGAIYGSNSEVTVAGSTISGCEALRGGAIYSGGAASELVVKQCCCYDNISNNHGLDIHQASGVTTLLNSTLFSGGTGASGNGSVSNAGGQMGITSCLMNGVHNQGTLTLGNNIITRKPLQSPSGTVASNGYNLCSTNGGGLLTHTGDQINTDPKLDPRGLRNNGGGTLTVAVLGDSPALDKGFKFGLTQDQRFLTRPVNLADVPNATGGDGSDIGPMEMTDRIQGGTAIQVTTLDDHDDGSAGLTDCTLREALSFSDAGSFVTTISFAPGLTGTITLSPVLGQLQCTHAIAITGPGARVLAVSGNNAMPLFRFSGDTVLSGLTLRNGRPDGNLRGGAIDNFGSLTVRGCAFTGCQFTAPPSPVFGLAGGTVKGGAIANSGTLHLEQCSFSGNLVHGGTGGDNQGFGTTAGAGGGGLGGAVFNDTAGTLTADNCTFYNNTGIGGDGGYNPDFAGGRGGIGRGAIYNQGTMILTSCTFSGNTSTGGPGGVGNNTVNDGRPGTSGGAIDGTGSCTIRNTISAGNNGGTSPDALGTFISGGFNLIGRNTGTTGFTAAGDRTGTAAAPLSALLGPFQDNGGQTDTLLPGAGSVALDGGKRFDLLLDQRSNTRRYDNAAITDAPGSDGTDIGAVESGSPAIAGFRIITVEKSEGFFSILVHGSSLPYFRYQLQKSDNPAGPFTDLGPARQADSNGFIQFIDASLFAPRAFYNIVESAG